MIIAVAVGIGYLAILHSSKVIEAPANITTVKDSDAPSTGLEKTQVVKIQPSIEEHERAVPNTSENSDTGFVRQEPPMVEVEPQMPPSEVPSARAEGKIPNTEMQQLMQAAGKTLRE